MSFGGFVAQRYAAAHPDHPAGLILVSTSPRFADRDELEDRFRQVGGELAADVFRRAYDSPSDETAEEWRRVIGPLMAIRTDTEIERLRAARIETMEVNRHFLPEGKTVDLRGGLQAVRCPTLVVIGEQDPLTPVQLGQEIVEAMPKGRARLEVIPDASHDVLLDNPVESYRVIRDFLMAFA